MSSSGNLKCPVSPGDVIAGKYRVERILGSGGMGVVVAARHLDLDQQVALKFILPQALAGKGNVERFMREARAAVRLKSEHVARVYDVGRDAHDGVDRPFMVLELLEGMDLAKLTKTKGSLPVADSVEYILQACEALVEAHSIGIVHRDLKPQNLFVTRRLNGTALVKVLDFGIAKAFGPGAAAQLALTDSSAIIGSPFYMAPEQMRSARTAEIRSDIWALGVVLFELLGGQLPFEGETVTEVCIRVVNEPPPDLMALRPSLEPALVAIVMRCLEKDPDQRFHNVSALAAALEPFSRSAKQGGPVRPWRSFEDTQDSANGNPFASVADATGPSLPTVETGPKLPASEDELRARAGAGGTKVSAAATPLVSTGSAWAESTGGRLYPVSPRGRSFSTRVVVAIVAAAAVAAAAGGAYLGRGADARSKALATATAADGVGPQRGAAIATSAKATPITTGEVANAGGTTSIGSAMPMSTISGVSGISAPATGTTMTVPTTPAPADSARGPRLLSAGKPPRLAAGRPGPAPTVVMATTPGPARTAETKAADPVSPNGAPILH